MKIPLFDSLVWGSLRLAPIRIVKSLAVVGILKISLGRLKKKKEEFSRVLKYH